MAARVRMRALGVNQFGIGLAVAVILDDTVVRCLLVPALMIPMGKTNWYVPRWLGRLGRLVPHISIQGAEFLEQRHRHPAAEPRPELEPVAWPVTIVAAGASRSEPKS